MEKNDVVYLLCQAMTNRGLTNWERNAMRSAINTLTWLIARRAKQRASRLAKQRAEKAMRKEVE